MGLSGRNHDQHRDSISRRHSRQLLRRCRNRLDHSIFQLATVFLSFRIAHVRRRSFVASDGRSCSRSKMVKKRAQLLELLQNLGENERKWKEFDQKLATGGARIAATPRHAGKSDCERPATVHYFVHLVRDELRNVQRDEQLADLFETSSRIADSKNNVSFWNHFDFVLDCQCYYRDFRKRMINFTYGFF